MPFVFFLIYAVLGLNAQAVPRNTCKLGSNENLGGFRSFPDDNPWNQDISAEPGDPNSATYLESIGLKGWLHPDFGTVWNGGPSGIPYALVSGSQSPVHVTFGYADESDPGPYPIPRDVPIENGSDRHV